MDNYYKINQEIVSKNQKFNAIRNPETNLHDIIRVNNEINAQGLIPIIHTYNENGNKYHKSYELDKDSLKQFIQTHRTALITVDGVSPNDFSNRHNGVDIGSEMSGRETIIPDQYRKSNHYADFQPVNSFKSSFNEKYHNEHHGSNLYHPTQIQSQGNGEGEGPGQGQGQGSNISGNDVNFICNQLLCDDANS